MRLLYLLNQSKRTVMRMYSQKNYGGYTKIRGKIEQNSELL